ncbi:hypothetical protein FOQG_18902 [Fusarium oxysporum f. sp. raphani 54005]|uniref:DJ-1/PfpI domain-containing protein n=1 Tax=Fusarium oxysporum f. sp. raphani 54005 TaxID=1089458 RepID=X0B3N3_FUSOX|nr:hypothetical protein FOQG_18902 [Fusarium oxysporum f. sp. raphani 54005]
MASINVGILVYDYQAIDVVGPVDLLHSANSGFLEVSKVFGPIDDDAISRAPNFIFHHVGITKEPFHLFTSAITLTPTTTVDECPELDIILLGGPNPVGFELHQNSTCLYGSSRWKERNYQPRRVSMGQGELS